MPDALLLALKGELDAFLDAWEHNMDRAGYLLSTTAKRDDCARSFFGFLQPLWAHLEGEGCLEDFHALLENSDGWATPVLEMAERHRLRGVTPEMFLGCFKTLVHSLEEILHAMPAAPRRILLATRTLRRYADALDTLLVRSWSALEPGGALSLLDDSNRRLTLEKNKFENIFAATSDVVLVADSNGNVLEANHACRAFLDGSRIISEKVWHLLRLDAASMEEVLERYPPQRTHEIRLYDGAFVLELKLAPLKAISLASSSYLFLLGNITSHVRQRELLAGMVEERTAQLSAEKTRLEEMNITLRHVMASIEQERESSRRELAESVRGKIIPTLARLKGADSPPVRNEYICLLTDQLAALCAGADGEEDCRLLRLTPAELQVCQFIQSGRRTKNIAEALNISVDTVWTHRKNIRKKLSLKGPQSNLTAYLRSRA